MNNFSERMQSVQTSRRNGHDNDTQTNRKTSYLW